MEVSLLPYRPERDVYRLLGLPPSADDAQIATACRRLARTFHPDRNGSPQATTEMQVVNAVRSLLSDPRSRAEYDRARLLFLSRRPRPVPSAPPATAARSAPAMARAPRVEAPRSRDWALTARALMAGLVAGLQALSTERCPGCDAPVADDYRFCGGCGERLVPAMP